MKSMIHSHDGHLAEILPDEKVEEIVDRTLDLMDLDRDGLIDFAEFKKGTNANR
ncbi:EF hand [Ostertagia ostertagi]